jgi:hypothetical protein
MRKQICVASVNFLELPADGHFAWDVRWQGLNSLRENSPFVSSLLDSIC